MRRTATCHVRYPCQRYPYQGYPYQRIVGREAGPVQAIPPQTPAHARPGRAILVVMDPLPTGTVTMLFSDIEGSTALLSRLGDRYGEALSAQRRIVRAAINSFHGREMGTEGDSFFVVFEFAQDALRACVQAQHALQAHRWPQETTVRVRMGLHTGEPVRLEEGYVGMDLNRAARIASTAHGGQIVLSDATRRQVAPGLPPEMDLLDLGSHRLKDIDEPEHIFQLTGLGLPVDFPPLKSLGAQTSLPVPATPLVGRDDELAELRAGVGQVGVRLVTLTGPGGVGKTRLGLALAGSLNQAFSSGVFFVPLATVTNADVMWKVIADSVGADTDREPATTVVERLAGRQALLVLDNLEQLGEAAGVISALLAAAPGLTVIATSRRPIHLQGEVEYAVPALAVPDGGDVEAIAGSAAVALFVQQAGLVRRGFAVTPANAADIAAICRRLDGLPLAIELAASRVKLLPPRALLARLGDSLDLAATDIDRPGRQQTLRSTIAWSYDLLSSELADVFARMGVFAGGCDLDAVGAVACPPGVDPLQAISDLLDASLVTITEAADGEPRVGMLVTIGEYAVDRLARSGGLVETRQRHADYYARVAEQADGQRHGPHQLIWLDRLEIEHDNMRSALTWSLDSAAADRAGDEGRARTGLRLVNALSWFWYGHNYATDGRHWLELAIDQAAGEEGPQLAQAVHGLGILLLQQGEHERARATLEQNLTVWRRLGDIAGLARGLNSLGVAHRLLGQCDLARERLAESIALARAEADDSRLTTALSNLAVVEIDCEEPERAMPMLREAIALDRRLGDLWAVASGQVNLAGAMILADRAAEAHLLLCSIAGDVAAQGDQLLMSDTLELLAAALAKLGADARSARLAGAGGALRETAGLPISAPDKQLLWRALGPARERIGHDAWKRAYAAGQELTAAQAVELARQPAGRPLP